MIGNLKSKIQNTAYRLKIRNAVQQISREQLQINLEEVKKEIERRNKKK